MKNPLSIVLDAAQEHVNEIESRNHSDATIAQGERIALAIEALRDQPTSPLRSRGHSATGS
ncbi:MAG: hypothetical protein ACYC0H_21260 [Solirubrobacteraceae bacterium]